MMRLLCVLLPCLALVESQTVIYDVQTCDGAERKLKSARLVAGEIRGSVECRYAPQEPQYLFGIYFNNLNLKGATGACSTLKIISYTTTRVMESVDEDNFPIQGRGIKVPEDPQTVVEINCNNYLEKIGTHVRTSALGQKIQLEYDGKTLGSKTKGAFDITLTSYAPGDSYQCEASHFRCWSTKYMCIDSSLECDRQSNCPDNSDEDNFKCTGKVAGMQLPLFIIIIVLLLLLLVGLIVGIVLYRRRRNKKMLERRNRVPMGDPRQTQPLYTHDPSIVPPEASIAPSSSHQYSAYA